MKKLAGLLIGFRGNVAMGRFFFCLCFGLSVYFWLFASEAYPATLWETMMALLIYNFGGKAANY